MMAKVIGERTYAMMDVTTPLDSGLTKFGAGHEATTSRGGTGPPGISTVFNQKDQLET
jgi:hypothetical protein